MAPGTSDKEEIVNISNEESPLWPWGGLGLAIPIVELGPGTLGADISCKFYPSASPAADIETEDPESAEDWFAAIFIYPLIEDIGSAVLKVMGWTKIGASVFYTVTF